VAGFLDEVGSRLADQAARLLLLPGAVFCVFAWGATQLGQAHWRDLRRLDAAAQRLAAAWNRHGTAGVVVGLAGLSVAAAAAGMAAKGLGRFIGAAWEGKSPPWPLRLAGAATWWRRRLYRERSTRGDRIEKRRADADAALNSFPDHPTDDERKDYETAFRHAAYFRALQDRLDAGLDRGFHHEPVHPTWIAERVELVRDHRTAEFPGLPLDVVWPHLWLLLPDTTRTEVTEAAANVQSAQLAAGWLALSSLVCIAWWPAALALPVLALLTRRARGLYAAHSILVEAAVDLHLPALLVRVAEDAERVESSGVADRAIRILNPPPGP
jgi:hypothetical protein